MFFQKILYRAFTAEVAGHSGQFSHDIAVRPGFCGFHIVKTDPIVSNQRIGHDYRLAGIGRVCQHFQVSRHGSVKHYFADHFPYCADAYSFKYVSVFKY